MESIDLFTVIITLLSFLIGALITAYFAWRYYQWASEDLNRAAEVLTRRQEELNQDLRQEVLNLQQQLQNIRSLIMYTIQLLADAGQIEPRRDEQGNLVLSVRKDVSLVWNTKDKETEEKGREKRERAAREERERELSRRPFRGLWRHILRRTRRA